MEAGIFMMPSHPPERSFQKGFQWDLDHLALCDELGFEEAWIGEHFTSPWEPNPAPDLLIAQALLRTKRMKLAPGAHLLPYHHPVELAGEHGFMPMSLNISPMYLKSHWESVVKGAEKVGRTPLRSDWRIVREVFVAETDAEARRHAIDGMLGRAYREYLLPLFGGFGFLPLFKHDPAVPDSDVTPEYLVDHGW